LFDQIHIFPSFLEILLNLSIGNFQFHLDRIRLSNDFMAFYLFFHQLLVC
jgi:hypothetical protein